MFDADKHVMQMNMWCKWTCDAYEHVMKMNMWCKWTCEDLLQDSKNIFSCAFNWFRAVNV